MRSQTLGDVVTVKIEIRGRIIARTFQERPHFDIVTPDGSVWQNIPSEWLASEPGRPVR